MLLFYIFVFCIVVQCCYAAFFILGLAPERNTWELSTEPLPVSIIICAKDASADLSRYLPAMLQQYYPAPFEVIVVNDHSQDDTENVLRLLAQQYPNLRHINVPPGISGKKHALAAGTTVAAHNWFLLTDADSVPCSNEWLQQMTAPLCKGKEIIAGLGAYTNSGGLLQTFIWWETVHTFMQFAGYAGNGLPYMATGRNMACTRTAMEKAIQHPLWQKLSSGHDDIIVQAAGSPSNTAVVCNKLSYTISSPKTSWKEWAAQKQRHVSTGKHYRPLVKYMLGLYAITHAAVWLLFFPLLFTTYTPVVLLLFVLRFICASTAFNIAAGKAGPRQKGFVILMGDLGWMIYNFAFLPYIAWKNKTNWK